MSFNLEHEMGPPVRNWLQQQGFQVKQEYATPWGICDFVAVSLNVKRVNKRLQFRQINPIGPLGRIGLLRYIPDKNSGRTIALSRLQTLSGAPVAYVQAEVEKLIASRFVLRTDRGTLQKQNGWVPLHNRIIAIELKLNRIADALVQARSNRAFASESFIAVPAETGLRLTSGPRRQKFVQAGVGILGVTNTNCKVILKPSGNGIQPDLTLQMHCVERFWRTKDNST